MNRYPKVTVVMTTYNGENYVIQQVISLMQQDYIGDIEVIICDDCSSDETCKLLNDFIKNNKLVRWNLYINEKNVGWKSNFIQAIKKATGEIVFLADQDDIWMKSKISEMVDIFFVNPQAEVVACNLIPMYESGSIKKNAVSVKKYGSQKLQKVNKNKHILDMLRPGCCMAFRKELIPIITRVWTPRFAHDYTIWVISGLRNSLFIYNESLIYQRRHMDNNNPESAHDIDKRIKQLKDNFRLLKNIKDNNICRVDEIKLTECLDYYKRRIGFISKKNIKNFLFSLLHFMTYPKTTTFIYDIFV